MAKSKAELMAEKMERERVGQAAFEAGMKPAVETTLAPETKQPVIVEKAEEKAPTEPSKAEQEPKETKTEKNDILAGLKKKKIEKKAYGYYLSVANGEKLIKAAKAQKVSASELLDHILTNLDI